MFKEFIYSFKIIEIIYNKYKNSKINIFEQVAIKTDENIKEGESSCFIYDLTKKIKLDKFYEVDCLAGRYDVENRGNPVDINFDILLFNSTSKSQILYEIGIIVMSSYHINWLEGMGGDLEIPHYSYEIKTMKQYDLDCSQIKNIISTSKRKSFFIHDELSLTVFNTKNWEVVKRFDNPILLKSNSAYRFDLKLLNYFNTLPNHTKIKLFVKSNSKTYYSGSFGLVNHSLINVLLN